MSLYELMNNTTIQGHVRIVVFDHDGSRIEDEKYMRYVDDLAYEELPEGWEDMTVEFLYWDSDYLTIEIYMKEEG